MEDDMRFRRRRFVRRRRRSRRPFYRSRIGRRL